jgi:hypothetical protein
MIFTRPIQPEPEEVVQPEVQLAENATSSENALVDNDIPPTDDARTVCVQCRHHNPDG